MGIGHRTSTLASSQTHASTWVLLHSHQIANEHSIILKPYSQHETLAENDKGWTHTSSRQQQEQEQQPALERLVPEREWERERDQQQQPSLPS